MYEATTLPGTTFAPFSIPLTETGWRSSTFLGAAISQANFKTILSNPTSLEIRGEYVSGPDAASLDNVLLQATPQATPEPTTIAALGLGVLGLVRRRARR